MKKIIPLLLKFVVTISIFYFLFRDQDFEAIYLDIVKVDISLSVLAATIYLLTIYVYAYRWDFINRMFKIKIRIYDLFKHNIIGFFFNNALPSTIGGDFWRMKALYPHTEKKSHAFFILLIERLAGFLSIFSLGFISIIVFSDYIEIEKSYKIIIILVSFLASLLIAFLFSHRVVDYLRGRLKKRKLGKILQLLDLLSLIQSHKREFFQAVVISILAQIVYGMSVYIVIKAMGEHLNLSYSIFIVPIVFFVTIFPISINGWGIREGVFVFFLSVFEIPKKNAISIALMFTIMQLLVSLIGGALFLLNKRKQV